MRDSDFRGQMSGERLFCVILTAPPPVNPVPHRCFRRQHDKSRQISTCARSLATFACFSIAINRTGGLFRRHLHRPLVNFHHRTTALSPRSRTCISCRRWTRATRCLARIVWYTEMDARCDTLAKVVTFVEPSLQHAATKVPVGSRPTLSYFWRYPPNFLEAQRRI